MLQQMNLVRSVTFLYVNKRAKTTNVIPENSIYQCAPSAEVVASVPMTIGYKQNITLVRLCSRLLRFAASLNQRLRDGVDVGILTVEEVFFRWP